MGSRHQYPTSLQYHTLPLRGNHQRLAFPLPCHTVSLNLTILSHMSSNGSRMRMKIVIKSPIFERSSAKPGTSCLSVLKASEEIEALGFQGLVTYVIPFTPLQNCVVPGWCARLPTYYANEHYEHRPQEETDIESWVLRILFSTHSLLWQEGYG
jgi:hypothetical protein